MGYYLFQHGQLFQSGAKVTLKLSSYFKVEQGVISRWGSYFKEVELFQSEAEQRQPKLKFLASCESLTSVQFKSCIDRVT